jgi:hypothetical protein
MSSADTPASQPWARAVSKAADTAIVLVAWWPILKVLSPLTAT